MVGKKLAVDGATTSIAILDAVPEIDSCLTEMPAEVDFFST